MDVMSGAFTTFASKPNYGPEITLTLFRAIVHLFFLIYYTDSHNAKHPVKNVCNEFLMEFVPHVSCMQV